MTYQTHNVQNLIYHAEKLAPRSFKFKTGQIIKLLSQNPKGLSRNELFGYFCQNFSSASIVRRESLRMCVEKLIQRSRHMCHKFDLTIEYNKQTKKYILRYEAIQDEF